MYNKNYISSSKLKSFLKNHPIDIITQNSFKVSDPGPRGPSCSFLGISHSIIIIHVVESSFLFVFFWSGMRHDANLALPIRQTASIFKQPVTVIRNHNDSVTKDLKHGPQEPPKQVRVKHLITVKQSQRIFRISCS